MCPGSEDCVNNIFNLLEDERISSEKELRTVLQTVAGYLCSKCYPAFLQFLLSPPDSISRPLLGLFLACKESGKSMRTWIYETFPHRADLYLTSSHYLLLEKMSLFIPFIHPFERDISIRLNDCRTLVEYSPLVIRALLQMRDRSIAEETVEDEDPQFFYTSKRSQRQRKGARSTAKVSLDAKTIKAFDYFGFEDLDYSMAQDRLSVVMEELLHILEVYLRLLRNPEVEASIVQACFPIKYVECEEPEQITEIPVQTQELAPVETSPPTAFPMVQPMKAALYFESVEGFGDWRILISTRADRDLRDARRKDAKFFKIIIKKIKELSKGHFSDDNQKRLNGANTEIPIYEAKMTRDSRLVYQIDCIPEYDTDIERQVIKIFGVYTHAQIDKRLWDSVGYQLARKGKQYRQRCLFRNRPQLAGDNVYTPACFPPVDKIEEDDYILPELPPESLEEMHSVLVLEKFVAFSQTLLNSIIADLDVAHVFNVSPQEKEIVEYPHSCYVLGRSGTGKTTTMLFKMLGIERAYATRKDTMHRPRQIFVTQSRVLAGKVEEYFAKLLDSLATAERTKEELAQIVKSNRQKQDENGLIDVDDDHNWRADLPQKYSELKDEHFPLFVTFDRLATLLEGDIIDHFNNSKHAIETTTALGSNHVHQDRRLVTYSAFLESYWPHFSQSLKKGLDPALVFSELMGVIQGSEESLSNENGFLEKETYEGLSHRAQYAFANRREIIYSIFLHYLKRKKTQNEYDAADRTHAILRAFKKMGIPGQRIDYLYVDEAQDNLLIDALLLRSLVQNPDGLFWAGDTAQTISIGSSFRFNDLKAFLFRLEKRREGLLANESTSDLDVPRSFQLAVNYRSHGGIVQCAHSVIELITEFWPYAIDVLSRERGVVDGSKPVFFSGWDKDTVRYEQFLFGESGNPIEFGAQQCILVRDEASREELRQQVGDIGLIMTLYESKGLEFDDVLLYKFFEDSTVDLSQWRVVLNLMQGQKQADAPAPRFDEIRHAGVCSELKFLYVAITRARKNLWLVDCSEKGEPMRQFWTSRNEIQNCTPGTDVPRLAVSSSPQEWENSGRTLFQNKRYFQAMHCFERAGLTREVAVSHTYYLREQARAIPSTGTKQNIIARQSAFLTAAEAFLQCCDAATNAKEKKAYLRAAGDCFERAQEDNKAADSYARAEEYNAAVKLYRKCAKFDEAVAIVLNHRPKVDVEIVDNIIDVARLFYFKGGELEKTTQLFSSIEEQLEYLEDYDLDASRAALLEQLGQYSRAAEIHLEEGRISEAIRLYLKDSSDKESMDRGIACILQGLWEKASFGVKSLGRIQDVVDLLDQASKIEFKSIYAEELSMFETIRTGETKRLRELGHQFARNKQTVNAVFCYDHVFQQPPNMYRMSAAEIADFLGHFLLYCDLLQTIANTPNPVHDLNIRKLFNIAPTSGNVFFLAIGTFLHDKIIDSRARLEESTEQGIFISEWELSRKFRGCIMQRLTKRILAENDACKLAQALHPCPSFVINSQCNRIDCPRQHIKPSHMTRDWFDLQMKIHLRQIIIVQILCTPPCHPAEKIKHIRIWLGRFFETLYPIWFQFGGLTNFVPSRVPEHRRAFGVLKQWCFEFLHWPEHRRDSKSLTSAYQVIKIYNHLDKPNAPMILLQSPFLSTFLNHADYFRVRGNESIYIIPELVNAITTVNDASVYRGVLFMQHLIEKMLPIDTTLLCGTIEFLCTSVILVRNRMVLHNVNLPLSWLKPVLTIVSLDPKQKMLDMNPVVDILSSIIKSLIENISANTRLDYLLVENSNLTSIPGHRNIYVARLCRALALVGYNINNYRLRDQIVSCMKGLKRNNPYPPALIRPYVNVIYWKDVARLVPKFANDTSLDEMIQLYEERRGAAPRPPPGIRRVPYKNCNPLEVSRLLESSPVFSNLRADAPEFVPKPRLAQVQADEAEADPEIEEPEVDNTEIVNTATSAESIAVANLPETKTNAAQPSEEKIQAVVKLQTLYRKKMRHRRVVAKTALQASRNSWFEACLGESMKIDWPQGSFYRFLFLGPLPHVLVCLDAAYTWAMDTKKRNKKRFIKASHQELEELNKRMTEQVKIIHEIRELQKALNPPSDLHRRRDVEELKKRVLAVEALLQNQVAQNVARDVKEDMELGLKGIVAVKQPPKTKAQQQKPELRIDDEAYDDDYGYDEYEQEEEERDTAAALKEERDNGVAVEVVQSNYLEKPVPREMDVIVSECQEEEEVEGEEESAMNVDMQMMMEHQSGVERGEASEEKKARGLMNHIGEQDSTRSTTTTMTLAPTTPSVVHSGRTSSQIVMQQSLPWLPVNFHEHRSGARYIDSDNEDEESSGDMLMQSLSWIPM